MNANAQHQIKDTSNARLHRAHGCNSAMFTWRTGVTHITEPTRASERPTGDNRADAVCRGLLSQSTAKRLERTLPASAVHLGSHSSFGGWHSSTCDVKPSNMYTDGSARDGGGHANKS